MNEQLDKIADQVMYEFKDAFSCSNECGSIPDEFFVRFAELIAQAEKSKKREWVGLTDEEIGLEWHYLHDDEGNSPDEWVFARAIEAKLKEKNSG